MAIPPNNNYLYGNTNLPYENNNQMAFRPNSMKDRALKQLDVMPDADQKRYDNLRKEDVEQFNKKGIPLSLPNDRYKGIEGYTANAAGYPGATMTDANSYITRKTPTDTFQSMFELLRGGPTDILDSTANLAANKLASSFPVSSNPPTDAFSYLNMDQPNTGITGAKMNVPENDLTNYNEHYNMLPEEEKEGFLGFLKNAGVNTRDFVMNNAARYGGAMGGAQLGSMFGPIGALAGMIGGGIFGNRFTNQPYIGAGNLYDGAGGFTAAQLDRQNALGGYYSDAARNQRSQANRVGNLIDRAASGKNFSRTNLKNLGGFTDNQIDDIVGRS